MRPLRKQRPGRSWARSSKKKKADAACGLRADQACKQHHLRSPDDTKAGFKGNPTHLKGKRLSATLTNPRVENRDA